MNWQPIETFPIPAFEADRWYMGGTRVLLWANYPQIGDYGYTKAGKGRWRAIGGTIRPTHWMPLPAAPESV